MSQSYLEFLQTNFPQRSDQKAYVEDTMKRDPRLAGLDFKQASQVLATATGFKPLERFTKSGLTRGLDYLGTTVNEVAAKASPADITSRFGGFNMSGKGSEAMETPFSQRGGDLFEGAARKFGAADDTAQAFRTAGEGLPNIVGQMSMAAIPGVGLPAMLGSMYGQGLDQAYQQGETGAMAHVSGAIGPAVSLATIGLARPLAGKAADVVMKTGQKLMGKGAADVIREGMEKGGELGLKRVIANKAIDYGTKVALKTGQEALVESAQAGIGIAGEIAQAAVLDPKEFVSKTMWDKQFWIPVITSELLEGVGGTVIGRVRNPLVEAPPVENPTIAQQIDQISADAAARGVKAEQLKNDPELARLKAEQQKAADEAKLYAEQEAAKRGINPADPQSDEKIIVTDANIAQTASSSTTAAHLEARTATTTVDETGNPVVFPAEESVVVTETEAIAEAASALTGVEDISHNAPVVSMADLGLNNAVVEAPAGATVAQAKANWMERVRNGTMNKNKDHRILTDEGTGNHISFRNPGTHQVGVLTHIVRNGEVVNPVDGSGKKVILRANELIQLAVKEAVNPVEHRNEMNALFGVELTDTEHEGIMNVARAAYAQEQAIPLGISFGRGLPERYVKQWQDFMSRSGIQQKLIESGIKLRLGETAYHMTDKTLKESPFDYFASIDKANNTQIGNVHYISRNRGSKFSKTRYETDLHEVGHTVGDLIRNGAFGADVQEQWNAAMAEAVRISQDDKYANEVGVKIALDVAKLAGETVAPGEDVSFSQYKHFKTLQELEAQTFQGYMLGEDTPWKAFVKKHFPRLHAFFSEFVAKLRLPSDTDANVNKKMDRYSANFVEGEMILKGLFNNHYNNVYNGKKRLQALRRQYKLNGTNASDALDAAWLEANTYSGHSTINDALAAWYKGVENKEKPTELDQAELIDLMEYVKKFNEINYRGYTSIENAVTAMPWVARLNVSAGRLEALRERLLYSAKDPVRAEVINKRLLTAEELAQAEADAKDITGGDPERVRAAQELLNRRDNFALTLRYVGRAVDEMFAKGGEFRTRPGQVVKQMFQIDAVVKRWFLGQLPGQDGIPMHEPHGKLTEAEMKKSSQMFRESKKQDRQEYLRTIHRWYPILAKGLKEVTVTKGKEKTYLSFDGTFRFESKGTKKSRKTFETFEEAESAAQVLHQQPGNQIYRMNIEQYNGKFVLALTKTDNKFKETTFLDDYDPAAAQAHLEETFGAEAIMGASELKNALAEERIGDEFLMTPAGKNVLQAKQAFAMDKGPQIMAKAHEFAPVHVDHYRVNKLLPAKLQSMEDAMQQSFKTRAEMQQSIGYMAKTLDIKELVTDPFQVVSAWMQRQFDPNYTNFMPELERHLNKLEPDLENYIHSYINYAKQYVNDYIDYELALWLNGESRNMIAVDPNDRNAGARATNNSVMMQNDVRSGVTAATRSLPGGVTASPTILANAGNNARRIFGAVPKTLQAIHGFIGQGAMHWSMTDPDFMKLGDFIHHERGMAQAMADEGISPLFVEGEMKEFNDRGKKIMRFVPKDGGKIDNNSSVLKIRSKPEMEQIHNDIIRLEQLGHMKFADQLVSTMDSVRKPAQELLSKIPDAERAIHMDALERRYASQYFRVAREINADRANHITSFAYLISLDNPFGNNADLIHDYSTKFSNMTTEERIQSLVQELNKTPEQATDLALRYADHEKALLEKHAFMEDHLEYVSENRLKNYHVGVVFKKGYKSKTGVKHNQDTPLTGYFDFNTLNGEDGEEGAYQFIARMKAEGHKVPDHPKDFQRQRWNYKPVSGSLEDIMARVVESRKMLIETLLYGKLPPSDLDRVVNIMDNTVQDILIENDIVVASKTDIVKRKFSEGRENLDMLDQYMTTTRRKAAAIARRRTDMMFKLYSRDARMLEKADMFTKMEQFKDGVRLKDSEAQRMISAVGFTMFMGGNISSGLVELFQFPITLSPMLMEAGVSMRDSWGIPAKLYQRATRAALARAAGKDDASIWSDKKLDPHGEIIAVLREAEKRGIMAQLRHHDISTSNLDRMVDMHKGITRETGVKGAVGHIARVTYDFMNKTYGAFNRVNTELGIAGTYIALKKTRYGLDKKLSPSEQEALQAEAFKLSDMANGSLQRLGRPGMFNTKDQGTRNVLSAYWSLQSFVNAQVANQIRFISKSIDSERQWTPEQRTAARKATVALFGVQFAGMGIMGFTLMPSISKLIEQLFGYDMEDELREALYDENGKDEFDKNFMGEMASNGILSAMDMPIDYGTRISVAGVGPLSGFDGINPSQMGGPLVGLATQAFKDLGKIKSGNMSVGEGTLNLLPMGLRRAARLAFVDDGKVYDANKRFLYEPTAWETAGMVTGFTPLRSRKEMKTRMEKYEAIESDKSARTRAFNQINANAANPMTRNILIERTANEFNMTSYEVAQQAAMQEINQQMGPNVREGVGPKARQASKLYPSPLGGQRHEERYLRTQEHIAKLGQVPRFNPRSLMNARMQDAAQALHPELPVGVSMKLLKTDPYARQSVNLQPPASMRELLQGSGSE